MTPMSINVLKFSIIILVIGCVFWYLLKNEIKKYEATSIEWGVLTFVYISYSALMIACIGSVVINVVWFILN